MRGRSHVKQVVGTKVKGAVLHRIGSGFGTCEQKSIKSS